VMGWLLFEARVAFRLAKRSSEVTTCRFLRGGVMGTGATSWLGILKIDERGLGVAPRGEEAEDRLTRLWLEGGGGAEEESSQVRGPACFLLLLYSPGG